MDSGTARGKIRGIDTREPAFNTPAVWIPIRPSRDQAEMFGYTVIEPASVLATHLTETVRRHADELLTRDAAKHLIDELKQTQPVTVEELIPGQMKLAEVQQVLQGLRASRCRSASWRRFSKHWVTTRRAPKTQCC